MKIELKKKAQSGTKENNNVKNKVDVQEDEIVKENRGIRFSSREIGEINKKIEDILTEISNGEELDINDEAKLDEAISLLSSKLVSANIITKNQNAEDIFKGGRNGLKDVIKRKSVYTNQEIEISKQSFKDLTDNETKTIKDTINEEISKEFAEQTSNVQPVNQKIDYKKLNPEVILEKVKEKIQNIIDTPTPQSTESYEENVDKTQKNKQTKHVKRVQNNEQNETQQLTEEKEKQYLKAITNYLNTMDAMRNSSSSEQSKNQPNNDKKSKTEASRNVNEKINRRKVKLQQVLDTYLDNPEEGAKQVKNDSDFDKTDSSKILEMLLIAKEASQINELAVEELEMKKGVKSYAKALRAESQASIDYYGGQLKVEKFKRDNPELYKTDSNSLQLTSEERRKLIEIKKIEKGLSEKKKILETREKQPKEQDQFWMLIV